MKALAALIVLATLGTGVWWALSHATSARPGAEGWAYALALARYEPLLALAGTNPAALAAAANELEEAQLELATLQESGEAARLVRSGLYPTQFLRSLAVLEEARQAFLRTGSAREGARYEGALEQAIAALRDDAQTFETTFKHAVPTDTPPYQVPSGTVSRSSILAALTELKERVQALSAEHARRKQCIYEDTVGCTMPSPSTLMPQASAGSGVRAETPPLVEEVLSIRAELLADAALPGAPVVALERSACVPSFPSPHYFLAREESAGPLAPPIEFVGDILLHRIPPAAPGPVLRYLAERGAGYYPPSPVAFYQCPGIGSDLGKIFAALDIYREFGSSSAIMSEGGAAQLLRDALEEESEGYTELALAFKNQSAHFEALVKEIAAFGKNDAAMKRAGIPVDVSALYLFYVKSGFPSLYLGFNASAVGESVSIYESGDAEALRERLVLWSEIRETLSREELLGHMRVFFTMHDNPQESTRAAK
jgi:hypothetical protein